MHYFFYPVADVGVFIHLRLISHLFFNRNLCSRHFLFFFLVFLTFFFFLSLFFFQLILHPIFHFILFYTVFYPCRLFLFSMPLASLLETNKPFVFTSSHSNGSSTELAPPSSTIPSLPRQVNNATSSPPPAATMNHTKGLPSSPLDRGHYHSSTLSSEYNDDSTTSTTTPDSIMEATTHQATAETLPSYHYNGQPSRPNGIGSHSLPSTTGTKALPHDHTTHITPSTSTAHTNSSQLLSPSTADPAALPTATVMTTSHNSSPPPSRHPQQSPNSSLLFTSPHLHDSSASLPSPNGPSNHNVPSPRLSFPPVDPLQPQLHHPHHPHPHRHHQQQQQDDRDSILSKHSRTLSPPLPSPSTISGTASATPPSLPPPSSVNKELMYPVVSQSVVPPPPPPPTITLSTMATTIPNILPTTSTTKRVTGQHNEGGLDDSYHTQLNSSFCFL